MVFQKEGFANCSKCGRKITYTEKIQENIKFKPKICAECDFYRKKSVQNVFFAICICSILFALLMILPIDEKIQIILSFIFLGFGIISMIIIFILKVISGHKKIDLY